MPLVLCASDLFLKGENSVSNLSSLLDLQLSLHYFDLGVSSDHFLLQEAEVHIELGSLLGLVILFLVEDLEL